MMAVEVQASDHFRTCTSRKDHRQVVPGLQDQGVLEALESTIPDHGEDSDLFWQLQSTQRSRSTGKPSRQAAKAIG